MLQEGGRALESHTPGSGSGALLEHVGPQLDIRKMGRVIATLYEALRISGEDRKALPTLPAS